MYQILKHKNRIEKNLKPNPNLTTLSTFLPVGEYERLKYCCICGRDLVFKTLLNGSVERYCSECDQVFFDTPTPAVIVAVTNADSILLTRSVEWKHAFWGLVAGYIKSRETAEEAAKREVKEEVGLEIFNLKLLRTYTRKNRNLLMIGFRAETMNTNIIKSKELEKTMWFKLSESLPLRSNSISTQIINEFILGK